MPKHQWHRRHWEAVGSSTQGSDPRHPRRPLPCACRVTQRRQAHPEKGTAKGVPSSVLRCVTPEIFLSARVETSLYR